ncbi:hypothetical protein [Paenibacillus sp. GCM10012306]|uniref:hypothetical protein n=1 Tax=Paenibacillus sp. GCM10012306 TaxID=3317342 RepID=UPI00362241E5
MLAHGSAAAEGWLALLEALPAAAGSAPGGGAAHAAPLVAAPADAATAPSLPRSGEGQEITPAAQQRLENSPATAHQSIVSTPGQSVHQQLENFPAIARQWMAQMPVQALAGLTVTGNDLAAALEQRPGPWVGTLLQDLLHAVASGDLRNHPEDLLLEAKRMVGHERD